MSDPQRRQVRVRRSPKVTVFLGIGAALGALVAVVAVNVTPADATTPRIQAIGFLVLLLAPVGALVGGTIALVIDGVLERRAKTVDAERLPSAPPVAEEAPPAEEGAPDAVAPDVLDPVAPDESEEPVAPVDRGTADRA